MDTIPRECTIRAPAKGAYRKEVDPSDYCRDSF